MLFEHQFDLPRIDIEATGDDHVLLAIDDEMNPRSSRRARSPCTHPAAGTGAIREPLGWPQ
jgi:hypothetical protein